MDRGPYLDPFHLTNPCCCCCGVVSLTNGVKTVATVSLVVSTGYGMLGIWFAFNALMPSNQYLIKDKSKPTTESDNLVEILLICAITSLVGGILRFLSSLILLRSVDKESRTPAKVWVVLTFTLVVAVTAIVLAAAQKNNILIQSMTMKIFLGFAGVDFVLLLYFLWVIIVFLKDVIDMPGL